MKCVLGACASLVLAVSCVVVTWRYALGEPGWPETIAAGASATALIVVSSLVAAQLLGFSRHRLCRSVRLVAYTVVLIALLSLLGIDGQSVATLFVLGVGGAAAALWVVHRHEGLRAAWQVGAPVTVPLLLGIVLLTGVSTDIGGLVWAGSDQGELASTTRDLLEMNSTTSYFGLGVPLLIMPAAFVVNAWEFVDRLALANTINVLLMPFHLLVVLPTCIGLLSRSVAPDRRRLRTGTAALVALVLAAYLVFPPGFVPERNASLVPLRLMGAVFGPEVLGLVAISTAAVILSNPRRDWNPLLVGLILGVAGISHERHLLLIAPFVGLLLTVREKRLEAFKTIFYAGLIVGPQFAFWAIAQGSWWFPNRGSVWSGAWASERSEEFSAFFGQTIDGSAMGVGYLLTNLPIVIEGSLWLFFLFVVSLGAVAVMDPERWRLWSFCGAAGILSLLIASSWINVVATWRYLWWLAPLTAILVCGVLGSGRTRSWLNHAPSGPSGLGVEVKASAPPLT